MCYAKKIGVNLMNYEQQDQHYVLLIQSPNPDHETFSHDLHWVQITFSQLDSGMTHISANIQKVILRVATCGVCDRLYVQGQPVTETISWYLLPGSILRRTRGPVRPALFKRSTGLKAYYVTSSHRRSYDYILILCCFQAVIFIY